MLCVPRLRLGLLAIVVALTAAASAAPPPTVPASPGPASPGPQRIHLFIARTLPGLDADAASLRFDLTRRHTAGMATMRRRRAEADKAIAAAQAARDWTALHDAAATRIGLGDARHARPWFALGVAALERPGGAREALEAGYLAFRFSAASADPQAAALGALRLMRTALARQGQSLAATRLLAEIVRAYPDDAPDRARLRRVAFAVRKIDTTPDTFPARACIAFTVPLDAAGDLHPGDYVTTQPEVKPLAATIESGKLCLAGLTPGTTTRVTLRPGLPGIAGVTLAAPRTLTVTLADRQPALFGDPAHFLIPASAKPEIGFSAVNVSKVKIVIARVAERSLIGFMGSHPLVNPSGYVNELSGNNSRIVFTGSAEVAGFRRNRMVHAVLPLAALMKKPGLYAVSLTPDDGTQDCCGRLRVVQDVLRTDLAPTMWRGASGLDVQIRRFTDASPVAGARIALIAGNNAVLASIATGADGFAHFAAPLLGGTAGQAPVALHISGPAGDPNGADFTVVDLSASPFDLSDRGVSGRAEPTPLDPYLWLDRGIYRPGETIHLGALLRNPNGKPLSVPLHLIVRRPGGQVFSDTVPPWTDGDSAIVPIRLSPRAQAGIWRVSLAVDLKAPALAERSFTVAAFVPARLAVDLGKPAPLPPEAVTPWPIGVRFLYGAPGAHLTGTATLRLTPDPTPFPAFKDYAFGLRGEIFSAALRKPAVPETDAAGHASVPLDLTHLPDSSHALQAAFEVTINDPSGRAVTEQITLPIRPTGPMIGIKQDFPGEAVDAGSPAAFDIVALDPTGKPLALRADLTLVRQDYEWGVIWNDHVARWRFTYVNRPVLTEQVAISPDRPLHLALPRLPYGRYRLRLVQSGGGLAATSTVFYSGWVTSSDPGVPTRVTVARDRKLYPAGATASLHVTAPFAGPATLVIANGAVLETRNFTLPKGGTDLSVPVSASWGAGAYAIVHVFRPAEGPGGPARAIGLAWLGLEPGDRALPMRLATQPLYRPDRTVTFAVTTTPGAYVTLAAVDEGVLRLTHFASPDPIGHFFGKRTLGVDIADEYAALLRPPSGQASVLHQGGGGDFGAAQAPVPQQVVSLFAGPVQAGSDGIARISLHLPDFNGQIRLMAVGWAGRAVGSISQDITLRHKVIADLLLPRFLAPGDHATIGVMLQNLDLPDGRFTVHLTASGAVTGQASATLDLAPGARHVLPALLGATALGTGHVRLTLSGPGGYAQQRDRAINVHVVRAPITLISAATIPPGGTATLAPDLSALVPGSGRAVLTLGNHLPFDPAAYMQALAGMRARFLEASVARGLPLTALHGKAAGPDPAGRLAGAVEDVLDDQRYDGAFGLWSSQDGAEPWLTAFATDFLLRARKSGAEVPTPPLDAALAWLRREVNQGGDADQADVYAAYVLALDGQAPAGAIRRMDSRLGAISAPLARAQLGAALALVGEPNAARAALRAALAMHNRGGFLWWRGQDWMAGYGTPLRDAWAVPSVIAGTGLLPGRLAELAADLPGQGVAIDSLGAQELAWAGFAAGIFGGTPSPLDLTIDGTVLRQQGALTRDLGAPATIVNHATVAVPAVIAATGIPAAPQTAAQHGMSVSVAYYSQDGTPIDPATLKQNAVFVMVISGRAIDSAPHHVLLTVGLPAGWELAGNISGGKVGPQRWLGKLTAPRARAAADDRYLAAFDLLPPCSHRADCSDNGHDQEFRVAVQIRAVTQGDFSLPGASLVDFNHPLIRATTEAGRVRVLAP